jgi:hypothetical protein
MSRKEKIFTLKCVLNIWKENRNKCVLGKEISKDMWKEDRTKMCSWVFML